jgi:16S rRNA (adenine1518-N6/adenine1519-N6)-dimethyltransferase
MHIKPVKRLGQSFLTYEPAADEIVAALELEPNDEVLEIGPGKGVLTERLARACRRVVAVEVDRRLVDYLRERFRDVHNLEVVHQDFLAFDLRPFHDIKLCGNLPYNISSQILFRLLDNLQSWTFGVFTLQREFALRLLGRPNTRDYGALTVLFELQTERTRVCNLDAEHFKPSPDVVSTVVTIRRRTRPLLELGNPELFIRVVKAAFAQRRKTLGNNLRAAFGLDRTVLDAIAESSGIVLNRRAETMTVEEFGLLADAIGRHSL